MGIKAASAFCWALAGAGITAGPCVQADMLDHGGYAAWEVCALCHGADGRSAVAKFPHLAGQKHDYIEYQVRQFRHGVRSNDGGQMQAISAHVQSLSEVAQHFSGQSPAAPINVEKSYRQRQLRLSGKGLFERGRADIPACQSCHGDARSSAPWLDGQHKSYLEKQLLDFASGARSSSISPMPKIAKSLSEDEISALSEYLSSVIFLRTK